MQQLIKEGEVVRAPVALALVKLIRLLPARAEQVYLPSVLQQVANVLKLRLQRIRYATLPSVNYLHCHYVEHLSVF